MVVLVGIVVFSFGGQLLLVAVLHARRGDECLGTFDGVTHEVDSFVKLGFPLQ